MRHLVDSCAVRWLVAALTAFVVLSSPLSAAGEVTVEVGPAAVDVRQGPGVDYALIGTLPARAMATALSIDPASGWLAIPFDRAAGGKGWITGDAQFITVSGPLANLPQAGISPTPAPRTPKGSPAAADMAGKLVFQTSTGGDIYIVNADGSGLRKLTTGYEPVLSPDGTKVAFGRWSSFPRGLWVIDADGTDEHLVFNYEAQDVGLRSPAWSPDGERLTFAFFPDNETHFEVCVKYTAPGPDGGSEQRTRCEAGPRHPWWKLATIGADGSGFRELQSHDFAYAPSWSADGVRIAYGSDQGLSLTSDDGSVGNVLDAANKWRITDFQGDRSPAWSPDGHRIAFQSKAHDHWEIAVINDDGQGRTQLTRSWVLADVAVNSVSPAWSPDGRYIAYLTDERGRWELYCMKADGSEQGPFLEEALKGITFQYNDVDERVVDWGR